MNIQNNAKSHPAKSLNDDVAAAIAGMIYISESEAPLELLPWTALTDLPSLQHKIVEQYQLSPEDQTIVAAPDFLAEIHNLSDPADQVIMKYVQQYNALFDLLKARSKEVTVIRGGKGQVHLFIAAFGGDAPVIIHASAVET
jgi:hypothetical protein